jgi:hypothetical protein
MPLRALKILVVVMGVMLIAGFIALFVAVGARVAHRRPEPSAAHSIAQNVIDIPRGARVEAMAAAPDRLVLDLVLPNGDRQIISIDTTTGARIGTIELHSAPSPPVAGTNPPPVR